MEISQEMQILHSQFCRSCGSWVTVKYVSFWECFIFWHISQKPKDLFVPKCNIYIPYNLYNKIHMLFVVLLL